MGYRWAGNGWPRGAGRSAVAWVGAERVTGTVGCGWGMGLGGAGPNEAAFVGDYHRLYPVTQAELG